ncbi:MAG: tetratricopeptide repeat protein [Flavobacteriales bacterium]|nr:tetratricopeptide repeat protein [Flavobacteriales bacterium]
MNYPKSITLLFLLISLSSFSFSQGLVDSLRKQLDSDIPVEAKLKAIKNASSRLLYSNTDTMAYYAKYALRMTEEVTKNKQDKIFFLGLLGDAEFKLSNYSEALKANFEACKLCEEAKDTFELAHMYNSIGSIYRVSNKLDEAKNYFEKSIGLRQAIRDSAGLAASYNNMGIVHMMTSKYDTGMDFWERSMQIKMAIGDSVGAATTMNNMAMYYRDIGEIDKALDYLWKAFKIKQRIGDHTAVSLAYLNLGELYIKQGNPAQGEKYYLKALDEASISKNKQLESWSHFTLAEHYYNTERYRDAYEHYMTHDTLENAIFNEETAKNLEVVESRYQNEKKAILIQNLEKDKQLQDEKQQLILISSGTGILALIIIVLVVTKNYRQKKKDNQVISEQKSLVEEKNKEITDSINYAKRIQSAILPAESLIKKYLPESFILYKPKDIVAGDFYWMETVRSNEGRVMGNELSNPKPQNPNLKIQNPKPDTQHPTPVFFAVADCTGHGVPGAMVSVVCHNALNRAVKEFGITEPAKILDKTRELVVATFEKSSENVKDGMDIALCSLKTQTTNNKQQTIIQYAGANNPLWIIRPTANCHPEHVLREQKPRGEFLDDTENKELEAYLSLTTDNYLLYEIKGDKQPIGIYHDFKPYTNHTFHLQQGDIIYLFSDGFADQFGGDNGKKLKYKPFKELLLSCSDQSVEEQRNTISDFFENWKGNTDQVDDVCIWCVKV